MVVEIVDKEFKDAAAAAAASAAAAAAAQRRATREDSCRVGAAVPEVEVEVEVDDDDDDAGDDEDNGGDEVILFGVENGDDWQVTTEEGPIIVRDVVVVLGPQSGSIFK